MSMLLILRLTVYASLFHNEIGTSLPHKSNEQVRLGWWKIYW